MIVYLAGPMSGVPLFNFPAFHAAAADLRARGWTVLSPAERDEEDGFNPATDEALPLAVYMQRDLPMVCQADGVCCLPGWRDSKGATLEVEVARRLGKEVWEVIGTYDDGSRILRVVTFDDSRTNVLREAEAAVYGPREADYGHPMTDFTRTAHLWTGHLKARGVGGYEVTPEDVAMMMAAVKVSRLMQTPDHHDSQVDWAGYVACYARVREARA